MSSAPLRSVSFRLLAIASIFLLAIAGVVTGAVPSAQGATRAQVDCGTPCTDAALRDAISQAGTTPTTITLGTDRTALTQTLRIPAGADIEIVANGDASELARADGFRGVLVQVDAGGSLTLNADVNARGTEAPATTEIISVRGSLVMDGGDVHGARNMSGNAAISVVGKNASFTLNGGQVTDNTRGQNEQYGAGGVAILDGAQFTMNGGAITNNTSGQYYDAGGLLVRNGGHAVINDGEISKNTGFVGGIFGFSWPWSLEEAQRNKDTHRNTIDINGGLIDGNTATFSGGGVMSLGNTVVNMTGGTISNNSAPNGGGVGTYDDYVSGADGTWLEQPSTGKQSGLSPEEWSELSPAAFNMSGGEIINNRASRTGGGVNVVSNAVNLTGGRIDGNYVRQQGGGVYVSTISYNLHVENVMVADNDASYIGGGLWLCPTGSLDMYVTRGGAILDNTAETYGDDIAHDNLGSAGALSLHLAQRMIGGGDVEYYWDNKDARFDPANPGDPQIFRGEQLQSKGLKSVVPGTAEEIANSKAQAAAEAALTITNNSSLRGGGIGSNGGVTIGVPDEIDVPVQKVWKDAAGKELPADQMPESIVLQLVQVTGTDADGKPVTEPIGIKRTVTPDADGNWSYTFLDLPATVNGQPAVYDVVETTVEGFDAASEVGEADASDSNHPKLPITLTNKQQPVETTPPTTPGTTPPETPGTTPPETPGTTPPVESVPETIPATTPVAAEGPDSPLAQTGAEDAWGLMLLGVGFVGAGALLVLRRKRSLS